MRAKLDQVGTKHTINRSMFLSRLTLIKSCVLISAIQLAAGFSLLDLPLFNDGQDEKIHGDYLRPNISPSEIIRARGFIAKDLEFTTEDGHKIHIVRGTNPLFNGGKRGRAGTLPILFVHGTVISASIFLATSVGAKPKNFHKRINLDEIDDSEQLHKLLRNDPSSKSLPFLAMNFGYEVWLFNRRGFSTSMDKLGHENRTLADAIASIPDTLLRNGFEPLSGFLPGRQTANPRSSKSSSVLDDQDELAWNFWRDIVQFGTSLKNLPAALVDYGEFQKKFIQTFDPDFWSFSLDEQAYYDTTEAIEFVIKHSGKRKVHTVGFSSGGALLLMATARLPKLNDRIASAVLWAPSLNLGSKMDNVYQLSALIPPTQSYSGPVLFVFMQQQIQALVQTICSTDYMQRNFCSRLADIFFGFSGKQGPVRQSIVSSFLVSTCYHELAHLGQMAHTNRPCMFNYNSPEKNFEAYGRPVAPCYKMDRVKLKYISIYVGFEDRLVSVIDVNRTRVQLGVPSKLTVIDKPGIYFNHAGSVLHEQTDRFVLAPSLLDFKRAEEGFTTDGQ